MKILFHRDFEKQYLKLRAEERKRFDERFSLFEKNPFHELLGNHALAGKYQGCRSIRFGGDLRAVYKVIAEDIVLFTAIGTHSKLYKL